MPDELPSDLHPVLRRVFLNRGVGESAQLDLRLSRMLPVGSFGVLEQAVDLLCAHRDRGSKITIVGDFDADGATATALLMRGMGDLGFPDMQYLVPDRFRFGYGLSPEIVALAAADSPGLIITVDNGISSVEGVASARSAGIDVLITDHHLPGATLPAANVILNPNLPGESFEGKALAGVGVAFYLLAAASKRLRPDAPGEIAQYLDLVALGTVADVVKLDHNNRTLVDQGLRRIRSGHGCPGILALLEIAGRDASCATASDLGFAAGPRLNAAGRLDDMSLGIACLLSDSPADATRIARDLDALNRERRDIEQRMECEALKSLDKLDLADESDLPCGLCLFDPGWHQGVVGLLASRVKDRVYRPVIAFARAGENELKGSARSIPGVHIRDALDRIATMHPGMLQKFGGHAMAAGLSLDVSDYDVFSSAFDEVVRDLVCDDTLTASIDSDGELAAQDLSLSLAEQLASAGPWGQGFPEPQFDGVFKVMESRVLNGGHLKLSVRPEGSDLILDAIAFRQALPADGGDFLRLVYRLEVNAYRGRRSAQLNVQLILPQGERRAIA